MNRNVFLQSLKVTQDHWDFVIIGGGATGIGVAVDAATRGYSVLLLEKYDFGKGTSSRSTKLVHGGVRYLQQGNISLVMEALKERGILLQNAPHLVHDLCFIVPNYAWWEAPFYGIGMKVYDLLAGKYGFGPSRHLSKAEVLESIPTLNQEGLRGGVLYHDGQFDDTRLLVNLAQTAVSNGARLINYAHVTTLHKNDGFLSGVSFTDTETGEEYSVNARCVINATGPFVDAVRQMDDTNAKNMVAPSQGIHVVLKRDFLPGNTAIMVPHTTDGRVMFAIPWHDHCVIGTTDTAIDQPDFEPRPFESEIEFILKTSSHYLQRKPTRDDILSVFTGIRPLVKATEGANTAALSRDHTIHISDSGLLTVTGGKWTTYRKMAEDAVDHAIVIAHVEEKPCVTKDLRLHGYQKPDDNHQETPLSFYGADEVAIRQLMQQQPELAQALHTELPIYAAQVIWAAQHEMARTVEDFLARRTRALFLNTRAALDMAPEVARLLAHALGKDNAWIQQQINLFTTTAQAYLVTNALADPS